MIYKTLHRKLKIENDLQNTTQKTKDWEWSTKHYTENKRLTLIYKTLHRKLKIENDLQNTTQKTKDWEWSTKHYTEN
jgi:hypothetical protein